MNRRTFLAVAGAASITSLAGCSTSGMTAADPAPATVSAPAIPQQYRDTWRNLGTSTFTTSIQTLTARTAIRYLEKPSLRKRVQRILSSSFDSPVAIGFIAHSSLNGMGVRATHPRIVMPYVDRIVTREMRSSGLSHVTTTRLITPRPRFPNMQSATREYTAVFNPSTVTKSIRVFGEKRSISIDPGPIMLTGLLSIWKPDADSLLIAGGVFPRVNTHAPDWATIRGGSGMEWLTGGLVDLVADPDHVRDDIVGIIENTTL